MHTRETNKNAESFAEGRQGRPEFCDDEHLEFLDDLRESGATNMYGAGSYLTEEFESLTKGEASAILGYWMKSFGNPNR